MEAAEINSSQYVDSIKIFKKLCSLKSSSYSIASSVESMDKLNKRSSVKKIQDRSSDHDHLTNSSYKSMYTCTDCGSEGSIINVSTETEPVQQCNEQQPNQNKKVMQIESERLQEMQSDLDEQKQIECEDTVISQEEFLNAKLTPPLTSLSGCIHYINSENTDKIPVVTLTESPTFEIPDDENIIVPEWYEELSDDHMLAFKDLFAEMEANPEKMLNVNDLYDGLRRVDSQVTQEEVQEVLDKVDLDKSGDISFDEFLYLMSQMGDVEYVEDGEANEDVEVTEVCPKRGYTKRQRLFFSAITCLTLEDIHTNSFRHTTPHVLHHYSAGERLVGLSIRQLKRHFAKMRKRLNKRQCNSPYSIPPEFIDPVEKPKRCDRLQNRNRRPRLLQHRPHHYRSDDKASMPAKSLPLAPPTATTPAETSTPEKQSRLSNAGGQSLPGTLNTRLDLNERGRRRSSVVAMLPGMDHYPFIQHLKGHVENEVTDNVETEQIIQAPEPLYQPPTSKTNKKARRGRHKLAKDVGWNIPRLDQDKVPLPVLKIKYKSVRPTMEDLPNIRDKVSKSLENYYLILRKAMVRACWEHWYKLYANSIRSQKLQANFRAVYNAYSPTIEKDTFVVCPWIPDHCDYFRTTPRLSIKIVRAQSNFPAYRPSLLQHMHVCTSASTGYSSPTLTTSDHK